MSGNLQTLINSAKKLSTTEQLELIQAVSQFLAQNQGKTLPSSDFWHPRKIEEIVETQQTSILQDVSTLKADFWPEDETADDFIFHIHHQRE